MKKSYTLSEELAIKIQALKNPIECKTCLFDSSIVDIQDDGECSMCKLQEKQRNQTLK